MRHWLRKLAASGALAVIGLAAVPLAQASAATSGNQATPATTCGSSHSASDQSGKLVGWIYYEGGCINFQEAELLKSQTGLTERVRYRNSVEDLLRQDFYGGDISGGNTYFWSGADLYAYWCYQALVKNSNHSKVVYGPVGEHT